MANKKINELVTRTPSLSDLILVGDPSSGYSYKATVTALATIIETDIADAFVTLSTTQTISGAKTFSNIITATSVANTPTDPDKFLTLNASNQFTYRTGSQVLSDIGGADDSLVVHKAGDETITGIKTFTPRAKFDGSINLKQGSGASIDSGYSAISTDANTFYFHKSGSIFASLNVIGLTASRTYTLQDANGTLAFTSDLSSYVPTTRTISTASPLQGGGDLSANRTISITEASTTTDGYLSAANFTTFNNKIGGSGTTNYIPKFTSSSAIGNSIMSESSSNINVAGSVIGNNFYIPSGSAGTYGLADLSAAIQTYSGSVSPTNTIIFYNGGSERMRLTSTGLGIGTSSPATKLDVNGSIRLSGTGYIGFGGGTNYIEGDNPNNILKFATNNSERMRLDASGNLGLGVTPSAWSGVTAFQNKQASFSADVSSNIASFGNNFYYNGSANLYYQNGGVALYQQFGNQHIWYNAPSGTAGTAISFTQAMTLDASGRLGIGTTSPNTYELGGKFVVAGSTSGFYFNEANNRIVLDGAGTYRDLEFYFRYANSAKLITDGYLIFSTANSERMRITSSGNVGIGTTSPSAKLHIAGTAANTVAYISETTGYALYQLGNTGGGLYYGIDNSAGTGFNNGAYSRHIYSTGAYPLIISTNDTERMRITSAGNVGIGTTSPSDLLTVYGTGGSNPNAVIKVTGTTNYATLLASNTSGQFYFGIDNSTGTGFGSAAYARVLYGSGAYPMVFFTNDTERMRITSGGNVSVGTSNSFSRFNVSNGASTRSGVTITDGNTASLMMFAGASADAVIAVDANNLAFKTGATVGQDNGSERMRITSGGAVGIGTTSPTLGKLQVEGSGGDVLTSINNTSNNAAGLYLTVYNGASLVSAGQILQDNGGNTRFYTGTSLSERMRITSGGNVGIGTTTPSEKLEVNGNIKTAAPSGGTAKPWKLGEAGVAVGGANSTAVRVEIDGTTYYLLTAYLP